MSKKLNVFQGNMEEKLIAFKTKNQYLSSPTKKMEFMYADFSENLFPLIKYGVLQYIYETGMPLHDYINHVRSSQAFALNLFFYPLTQKPKELLKFFGKKLKTNLKEITRFEFEYSPEENFLGEWKSDNNRPEEYVTAVDVRIDMKDEDNEEITILVEVKFTEECFTECGGYNSGANTGEYRKACVESSLLIDDYSLCYLNGKKLKRKYFDVNFNVKNNFYEKYFVDSCPFIKLHQCLRYHSLTEKIKNKSYFCLVYHDGNKEIKSEWDKYYEMCKNKEKLLLVNAFDIVNSINGDLYKNYFKDRYSLKKSANCT